ncbi:hypothetical protein pb186bvf_009576 [Paramecium bursaria]
MQQQFQRKSDLGSSNGFKGVKLRPNIRPQSSHIFLQDQCIIPFEMSDQAFSSQLKSDLMLIDQEIYQLNLDNRITQNQLVPQHIQKIKQFLGNNKTYDKIADPQRVIQLCKCQDAEETVLKLYNMIQSLDLYMYKVTELECLHFLKYNNYFDEIQSQKLQKISQQGIQTNRLLLSLVNMDRIGELVQKISKVKQTEETPIILKESQAKIDQLKQSIQEKDQLLQQTKSELNKLYNESKLDCSTVDSVENKGQYYIKIIDEVKDGYQNMIEKLQQENQSLSLKINDLSFQYDHLKKENQDLQRKYDQLQQTKDDLYKRFQQKYKSTQEYEDSYEAAIKDEYKCMQDSYDRKINRLSNDIDQLRRDANKKQVKNLTYKLV